MANRHARERQEAALRRKKSRLKPLDRLLIVCEGAKTEPLYFDAIRIEKRIPKGEVVVTQGDGTDPLTVVRFAETYFRANNGFDAVFAVFDRDDHATYHQALTYAAQLDKKLKNDDGKRVSFAAIPSVPSFELWLLLHFRAVTDPIHRNDVMASLRAAAHYPAYAKGCTTAFADTRDQLEQAVQRAQWLRERFEPDNGTDPYTDVDVLTMKLLAMAARFQS